MNFVKSLYLAGIKTTNKHFIFKTINFTTTEFLILKTVCPIEIV